MSQGISSTIDYPTLTQYHGPWLYKTQAINRYGIARKEIEAALLPCETGPNPHRRTTSYWKYNEPDVQRLASLLNQGCGLKVPAGSKGPDPGVARENGPVIDMRDVWANYEVKYCQLARIAPVDGWIDDQTHKPVWVYNVCDVEAVKRQIVELAPMLEQVLPKIPSIVTADGQGTFSGLKTNEWILSYGSEEEKIELARKSRKRSQHEGSRRRHNSNL